MAPDVLLHADLPFPESLPQFQKMFEAATSDWWAACDNADCRNACGEGFFQSYPDFVKE